MDEIGVEPGDQLAELDAEIATGWHDTPPAGIDANPLRGEALIGNLRPMLTSFIGRDREVGEVIGAVAQHRLVTLIGVGGVGKTRLAIESALESGQWPDGAWLVELGAVESDDEVADAVARVLGIRQTPGLSLSESILRWCHRREMLLILDNREHVLRSTARPAEALTGATDAVRVVATSGEALMVPGEHVQPVSVLALPDDEGGVRGAVELFIDRARSELSSCDPSHHHAAIADIGRRLAGPFTLDDAVAVADDDIDERDAVDALAHLVDRCLVARGDTPPNTGCSRRSAPTDVNDWTWPVQRTSSAAGTPRSRPARLRELATTRPDQARTMWS